MKTYILDIIPRIDKFSKQLDNIQLLTDKSWVLLDDINNSKRVFIFKRNKQLIISTNGLVEKGNWEFINKDSLLIETEGLRLLFKHGFIDDIVLALKLDSKSEYALFVNENKSTIASVDSATNYLKQKYIFGYSETKEETSNKKDNTTKLVNFILIIGFIAIIFLGLVL